MAKAVDGAWYVYTGENTDAIAVAMNGRGPGGGWTGIGLARMELPTKNLTREQINAAAKKMAAAPDLLEALQECLREHGGFTIKGECERRARAAIAKAI